MHSAESRHPLIVFSGYCTFPWVTNFIPFLIELGQLHTTFHHAAVDKAVVGVPHLLWLQHPQLETSIDRTGGWAGMQSTVLPSFHANPVESCNPPTPLRPAGLWYLPRVTKVNHSFHLVIRAISPPPTDQPGIIVRCRLGAPLSPASRNSFIHHSRVSMVSTESFPLCVRKVELRADVAAICLAFLALQVYHPLKFMVITKAPDLFSQVVVRRLLATPGCLATLQLQHHPR
mmetsp:Transcript_30577/g.40398  ORF Transcript_30577/g.40398 Transcript_30577/m.40398 type:complete len:231 (+) Transcript_30577:1348-2040(+)